MQKQNHIFKSFFITETLAKGNGMFLIATCVKCTKKKNKKFYIGINKEHQLVIFTIKEKQISIAQKKHKKRTYKKLLRFVWKQAIHHHLVWQLAMRVAHLPSFIITKNNEIHLPDSLFSIH